MVRIVEPLGDSREVAKIKAAQRLAVCTNVFGRIKAGLITTPAQAKAALHGPDEDDIARCDQPEVQAAVQRWAMAERQRPNWWERYGALATGEQPAATATGETITQALESWLAERARDDNPPRAATVMGHRARVKAFTDKFGDLPLTAITRAMASEFMTGLDAANRTRNNYVATLSYAFHHAATHGRFDGQNPFDKLRRKPGKADRPKFTNAELQILFDNMPHGSALRWVSLISLFAGLRLEETCQLSVADIRMEGANGHSVLVFDVHNGGDNLLKNESSARLVPVSKALIDAGLLDYAKSLPQDGKLFPDLRRGGKGKLGEHLSQAFRKLIVRLGIKAGDRKDLCFHSLRHNFGRCLDQCGSQNRDNARLMGHAVEGETSGTYGEGELTNLASIVARAIKYDGLIERAA
jgi:integrase